MSLLSDFGDFIKTPEGQGLLSGVFGYAANAQRGTPINNLGRGGLAGLLGYSNAQDRQSQEATDKQRQKLWDAQLQNYQAQADAQKAEIERQQLKQNYLGTLGQSSAPVQSVVFTPEANAERANQPVVRRTFDPAEAIRNGYTIEEAQKLASMQDWGRAKVARTVEVMGPNGSKKIVQKDEFGRTVGDEIDGYVSPVQVNQGNRITFATPTSGLSFAVNMSPSERDASARGWAGVNQAERRLQFDQQVGVEGGVQQIGLVKQFGKPPSGYRWKPDGNLEVIPGGPTDQKATAQDAGRGTVSQVISDLSNYYNTLDKEGAITSTTNRAGTNAAAWIGSTGVGQTVGSMFGTKAQSTRDAIEQTRPLLMQAIMKATGMSAKQMDSNAELKMYLATATDPTKSLEANRDALRRLEELYGIGGGQKSTQPAQSSAKTPVRTGLYNGRKVVQYSDGSIENAN